MVSRKRIKHLAKRAEGADPQRRAVRSGAGQRITEAEAKKAFVSLATKLEQNRAEVRTLIHGLDRNWPDAVLNDDVAPDLAFWLFGAAETVAELLDEALERARAAIDDTEESVRSEWEARRRRRDAGWTAELLSDSADADPEEP